MRSGLGAAHGLGEQLQPWIDGVRHGLRGLVLRRLPLAAAVRETGTFRRWFFQGVRDVRGPAGRLPGRDLAFVPWLGRRQSFLRPSSYLSSISPFPRDPSLRRKGACGWGFQNTCPQPHGPHFGNPLKSPPTTYQLPPEPCSHQLPPNGPIAALVAVMLPQEIDQVLDVERVVPVLDPDQHSLARFVMSAKSSQSSSRLTSACGLVILGGLPCFAPVDGALADPCLLMFVLTLVMARLETPTTSAICSRDWPRASAWTITLETSSVMPRGIVKVLVRHTLGERRSGPTIGSGLLEVSVSSAEVFRVCVAPSFDGCPLLYILEFSVFSHHSRVIGPSESLR